MITDMRWKNGKLQMYTGVPLGSKIDDWTDVPTVEQEDGIKKTGVTGDDELRASLDSAAKQRGDGYPRYYAWGNCAYRFTAPNVCTSWSRERQAWITALSIESDFANDTRLPDEAHAMAWPWKPADTDDILKHPVKINTDPTPDDLWRDYEISIIRHPAHKGWAVTRWHGGDWCGFVGGDVWQRDVRANARKYPTHAAAMEAAIRAIQFLTKIERGKPVEAKADQAEPTLADIEAMRKAQYWFIMHEYGCKWAETADVPWHDCPDAPTSFRAAFADFRKRSKP